MGKISDKTVQDLDYALHDLHKCWRLEWGGAHILDMRRAYDWVGDYAQLVSDLIKKAKAELEGEDDETTN